MWTVRPAARTEFRGDACWHLKGYSPVLHLGKKIGSGLPVGMLLGEDWKVAKEALTHVEIRENT